MNWLVNNNQLNKIKICFYSVDTFLNSSSLILPEKIMNQWKYLFMLTFLGKLVTVKDHLSFNSVLPYAVVFRHFCEKEVDKGD